MKKTYFLFVAFFCFIIYNAQADKWLEPYTQDFYSENMKYMFRVVPSEEPEIFDINSPELNHLSIDRSGNSYGILFLVKRNKLKILWENHLVNRTRPVNVFVSNDGKSVITIDNWGHTGYGAGVMAFYNKKGDLIQSYTLDEISPYPIEDLPATVSSIRWFEGARFISNNRIEITFRNIDQQTKTRIFNTRSGKFED